MRQLCCIATWGRPPSRRRNRFNYDAHAMPRFKSEPLSVYYCWYATLRCDLDLWSLTWTLIFVVHR